MTPINKADWVFEKTAADALGISREAVRDLAGNQVIASLNIPGCRPRYYLPDLERLLRLSVTGSRHDLDESEDTIRDH